MEATEDNSHGDDSFARLAERMSGYEKREDSTRRRLEEHLEDTNAERKATATALEAIRMDIHRLLVQKRIIIALILFVSGGIVGTIKWTMEHALDDMMEKRGLLHRSVMP